MSAVSRTASVLGWISQRLHLRQRKRLGCDFEAEMAALHWPGPLDALDWVGKSMGIGSFASACDNPVWNTTCLTEET